MRIATGIKLGLQVFGASLFLLVAFIGVIGPGVYLVGLMLGGIHGAKFGMDAAPHMVAGSLLASLIVWIPFVFATSGLGIILVPAFAAYALFVWLGLCLGERTRRKRQALLSGE